MLRLLCLKIHMLFLRVCSGCQRGGASMETHVATTVHLCFMLTCTLAYVYYICRRRRHQVVSMYVLFEPVSLPPPILFPSFPLSKHAFWTLPARKFSACGASCRIRLPRAPFLRHHGRDKVAHGGTTLPSVPARGGVFFFGLFPLLSVFGEWC